MPVEQEFYTEAEKASLRAQHRRGIEDAQAELRKRGVGPHPRVVALKAAGLWPMPVPGPDPKS